MTLLWSKFSKKRIKLEVESRTSTPYWHWNVYNLGNENGVEEVFNSV